MKLTKKQQKLVKDCDRLVKRKPKNFVQFLLQQVIRLGLRRIKKATNAN